MSGTEYKERILAAVPIDVYIGRFVPLKKMGKLHKGRCPFHTEKTPSFVVTPSKGIYHCFGCGKGGDLFSFVMEYEGVSFPDALDILGRYAGIEKPASRSSSHDKKIQALARLNDKVMQLFSAQLKQDQTAMTYLRDRGLTDPSLEKFQIGFSPDSWDWLANQLSEEHKELVELGILKQGNREKPYDFYRGRIMFPIQNPSGRILGFGGRILPGIDNPAKYLNSPESPLFHKSQVLYGLYQALKGIRETGECIITEGYLDVIGLYQAGFQNAVAPLGTAMGESHIKILHRYTDRLVILLDGDRAGRAAALRLARLLVDHGGISAEVVLLPSGQDPFDLSMQYPSERVQEVLNTRIPSERFLLLETLFPENFLQAGYVQEDADVFTYTTQTRRYYTESDLAADMGIEHKRAGMAHLFEFLREIKSGTQRELFTTEAARILNINASDLQTELANTTPRGGRRSGGAGQTTTSRPRPGSGKPSDSNRDYPSSYSAGGPEDSFAPPPAAMDYDTFGAEGSGAPGFELEGYPSVPSQAPERGSGDSRFLHRLRECEREILVELIISPGLIGSVIDELNAIEFADPDAEIIWRNMESRYLTGNAWTSESFQQSELPARTLSVVSGLLIKKSQEAMREKSDQTVEEKEKERGRVVLELLLVHKLQRVKEKLMQIKQEMLVANIMDRELLYERHSVLIKEKQKLDTILSGRSTD